MNLSTEFSILNSRLINQREEIVEIKNLLGEIKKSIASPKEEKPEPTIFDLLEVSKRANAVGACPEGLLYLKHCLEDLGLRFVRIEDLPQYDELGDWLGWYFSKTCFGPVPEAEELILKGSWAREYAAAAYNYTRVQANEWYTE